MTIATQSRTAGPFECNGSTTVYPFTFKVFTASDVSVIFRNTASGDETKLVLNIDYTVALNSNQNANPGGSITINGPAYESGNTLTLTSELQYLQPTDLTNNGGFYPKVISDALDRLTIFAQQIRGLATRSLKFPISDGNLDATVPGKDQRKGRVLAFDAVTGLPIAGPASVDIANLQSQFENAVSFAGYIPSGTFAAGATLSQPNQILSDGSSYWRWDGAFEKVVTAGSSPVPTGVGGWVLVSSFAFRAVSCLKDLTPYEGSVIHVAGFFSGSTTSGGNFIYDPSKSKTLHNVGTVIAPEALSAWDGTDGDIGTLHNWTGTGSGCFVRVSDSNDLYFSWFAPVGSSGLAVGYAIKSLNKAAYDGCSIFFDGEFKFPEVPAGLDGQITAQQYFNKNNLKLSGGKFVREVNSAEYALIFNENSGTNVTNVTFIGSSTAFEAGKGGIFFRDSTDYNVSHCFFEGLGDAWVRISRAAFTGTLPAPLTAERCSVVNNHIVLCGQLTTNNTGARHVLVANNVYENCYCALKVTARNTEIQGQILFTKNIVKGGEYGLEIQGGGNVQAVDNVFDNVKRPLQVAPSITGWNPDGSLGKHLGNYNIEFARNSIKGLPDLNQALIYVTYSESSNQGGFFKFNRNDIDLSACTNLVDVITAFQSSTDSPTPIVDAFELFEVKGNTLHGDINFLLTMPVNVGNRTKITDMTIAVVGNKLRGSCTSLVDAALEITNPAGIGGEFLINDNDYTAKGLHEFSVASDNTQLKLLEFVGNSVTADGTSSVFNFWYSARVTANVTKCARNTFIYKTNATGVGVRFGVPRTDRSNESSSSLFFYENNAYAEGTYPDVNVSPRCFYFNVVTSAKKYDRLVAYDNFVDNKNGKKCRSDTTVYSTSIETMVKQLDSGEKFDVYELKRTYADIGGGRTRNTIVRSDGSFEVFGTWQNTAEFSFTLPFILVSKDVNSFSVSVVPKNQNCTFKETSRATNAVAIVFVDAGSAVYPLFDYRISGIVAQSEIYNIIGI